MSEQEAREWVAEWDADAPPTAKKGMFFVARREVLAWVPDAPASIY